MNESFPPAFEEGMEKSWKKVEYAALAEGLSNNHEKLPFPGVNSEAYAKLKKSDEEFPGYVTPIDELITRFQSEGFKIVFGKSKENVYIIPSGSDDIGMDSIFPRHLNITDDMDEALKQLILANRE